MDELPPKLESEPPDTELILKIYSLMVEMSDRVSQRRQAANSFYLSVNTALIGGSAFLTSTAPNRALWVLGVAGMAICLLWIRNISSYKTLNAAKFEVIHRLEAQLPVRPYKEEWETLAPEGDGKRHIPFHNTERRVPFVFIGVHAVQAAYNVPWGVIIRTICNLYWGIQVVRI
jgi:hypothetical protein